MLEHFHYIHLQWPTLLRHTYVVVDLVSIIHFECDIARNSIAQSYLIIDQKLNAHDMGILCMRTEHFAERNERSDVVYAFFYVFFGTEIIFLFIFCLCHNAWSTGNWPFFPSPRTPLAKCLFVSSKLKIWCIVPPPNDFDCNQTILSSDIEYPIITHTVYSVA